MLLQFLIEIEFTEYFLVHLSVVCLLYDCIRFWGDLNMHEREILHENMSLVAGNNLSTRATTFMTKFHLAMASRNVALAKWRLLGLMTFGMGRGPSLSLSPSVGICHVSVWLKCRENNNSFHIKSWTLMDTLIRWQRRLQFMQICIWPKLARKFVRLGAFHFPKKAKHL